MGENTLRVVTVRNINFDSVTADCCKPWSMDDSFKASRSNKIRKKLCFI